MGAAGAPGRSGARRGTLTLWGSRGRMPLPLTGKMPVPRYGAQNGNAPPAGFCLGDFAVRGLQFTAVLA